jgi:drug/metabolite transporter (DMT)-like permease
VNSWFQSRFWVGTAIALGAAIAFALTNAAASLAYHGGTNPMTVAATRFVMPTILLIVWMRAEGVSLLVPAGERWVAVILGFMTAFYNWALLSALNQAPLAIAILVFYLFPFNTAVILAVFRLEKLNWQSGLAIAVAFAGLALALEPRGGNINVGGVAWAFASALGIAIVIVVSSRVFKSGDPRPLTLWMVAISALLLSALCAARGDFVFPNTSAGWIGFGCTTVLYGFALISFYIAVSMIGPARASLLSYVEPVAAACFGIVLFGETLTGVQIIGVALVIIALIGATARRLTGDNKTG